MRFKTGDEVYITSGVYTGCKATVLRTETKSFFVGTPEEFTTPVYRVRLAHTDNGREVIYLPGEVQSFS